LSFFVVVPVQHWLIGIDWYGLFSIFIPVYVFAGIAGGCGRYQRFFSPAVPSSNGA
jgi:hypothetical protein